MNFWNKSAIIRKRKTKNNQYWQQSHAWSMNPGYDTNVSFSTSLFIQIPSYMLCGYDLMSIIIFLQHSA